MSSTPNEQPVGIVDGSSAGAEETAAAPSTAGEVAAEGMAGMSDAGRSGKASTDDVVVDVDAQSDADAEGEDDEVIRGEDVQSGQNGATQTGSNDARPQGEERRIGSEDFKTPPSSAAGAEEAAASGVPAGAAQGAASSDLNGTDADTSKAASTSANPTAAPNVDALAAQQAASDAAANFLKQTFDTINTSAQTQVAEPLQPAKVSGDPLDHREMLRRRLQRDRRDGEAWLALIDDAMQRANLDEARQVYEDFVQVYPNAARQWQDYAALELQHSEFQRVEGIFTRCLRTTPSTDLWRFYLQYTRRVNPLPAASKSTTGEDTERDKVRKTIEGAYEFALRFIGQSRDAGDVWRDYIALLKERETSNQWQAGQKMDDIRRTYQRAVAVPLANVEAIWREYDAYENSLNRITAKKFLADRSAAYMTARTAFREMRMLTDGLHRPVIPHVPCWAVAPSLSPVVSPLTIVRDRHHVEAWKKYLRWEEGNPLQLEDVSVLQSRVLMAYRKATMHLRFYPEIWYMASQYLAMSGRNDEAQSWLKMGMDACAGSSLLCFAYVELAERLAQTQDCGEVFSKQLEWVHAEIDGLQTNLEERIKSIDEEAERVKAEAAARRRDEGASEYVEGEEREEVRKMDEEREARREAERASARPKIEEMKENASLVWIKYMHFVRRSEGQRPMRTIFARARKSKHCTWQIFEANALMEYHCSKDVSVAAKVFELALKTYGEDEAFVVRYLDFLLSINDDNNARALFERTVTSFPPERARPLWDRWCEYEYSFGDSTSIARLSERLMEIYPDEPPVKRLVDRNSYMDLDVVGPRDLGLRLAGAGGSSAAERAVIASRDMANDASGMPMGGQPYGVQEMPQQVLHDVRGPNGSSVNAGQPPGKRARFADEAGPPAGPAQQMPPTGPAAARPAIPTGPRGTKRSVSPPSRFVPPPREGPGAPTPAAHAQGSHAPQQSMAPQQPQQPAYLELPDGILFFMDTLPSAMTFDGPRMDPDDILECLARSNIPAPDLSGKMMPQQGFQNFQQSGAGFRGGRGGFVRGRGFARGGRRY